VIRLLLLGLLVTSAATSFAADKPWWEQPLLYPIGGKSAVRENVVYRTDGDEKLLADVYTPASGGKRPVVILIHGGPIGAGQQLKNLPVYRDYGRLLGGEGFVAVTFNHRYTTMNDFATSAADVRALIDYVRAHAAELKADPDRMVLWAFSGGGPLLTLGFDKPYVRALVDFYAILEGPAPYAPIARAGEIRVPMLIARGGHDMPEVNEPLKRFVDAALAHDVTLELLNHPAGKHAFDIVTDDARTRQIIGRTLAFIGEQTR
jgi:dienelactone hydrolase